MTSLRSPMICFGGRSCRYSSDEVESESAKFVKDEGSAQWNKGSP